MQDKKGMTLLEAVIALSLFAGLALSLMRITDRAVKYRKKISLKAQEMRLTRNFSQILTEDLRNIFFTEDFNARMALAFKKQGRPKSTPQKLQDWQTKNIDPYIPPQVYFTGGFYGKKDSLKMASLSRTRLGGEDKFSEQIEVSYYLDKCQDNNTCLWRKSSVYVDENPQEEGEDSQELVVLENIKKMEISYFNIFNNEWAGEWETDRQDNKNLPAVLKITLEYENKNQKPITENIMLPVYKELFSLMVVQ